MKMGKTNRNCNPWARYVINKYFNNSWRHEIPLVGVARPSSFTRVARLKPQGRKFFSGLIFLIYVV